MKPISEARGNGRRASWAGLLILALAAARPVPAHQAQGPDPAADPTAGVSRYDARIHDLRLYSNSKHLYADLDLSGAFVGEVEEMIESGLEVRFHYTFELSRKRTWWFNKTLLRRRVATRVVRDTLAGRYVLSREVDGEEVARTSTEDPEVMREWMTHLHRVPLLPIEDVTGGDSDVRIALRARAKIKDDYILLFIPWDFETDWERVVFPAADVPTVHPPAEEADSWKKASEGTGGGG